MAHKGRPGAWPSGQFELYDIVNNQITSAFNIGTVGLDFAVGGFAAFNQDGTTDMQSSAVATSREGRRRLRSGSPTNGPGKLDLTTPARHCQSAFALHYLPHRR